MKRYWPVFVIAAVLIAAVFGFRYFRSQQAMAATADLQTAVVERGKLTASIGATGTVRANQTAVLAWQTMGTIETVSVKTGDTIDEGAVLASLKQSSLPTALSRRSMT